MKMETAEPSTFDTAYHQKLKYTLNFSHKNLRTRQEYETGDECCI
jgi:hypothetical protein